MNNFIKRTISAFIYVIIFIFGIYFSSQTYICLIFILCLFCIWEFNKIINLVSIPIYFLTLIIFYFIKYYSNDNLNIGLSCLTIICSLRLLIFLFYDKNKYPKYYYQKIFLNISYIIIPLALLMLFPFSRNIYNPNLIIYIIILIWTNDSFAFLIGKTIGKTKLFKKISPKKTVEGFLGGVFFTILIGYFISIYSNLYSIFNWFVISLIVSIIGSLGDLIESKFKRQANIKDSGKIMPGHGGILDRLDSLLFISPFIFLYIHYII